MWYFLGGKCIWYEFLYFYVKIRRLSCMILNDSAEFSDNSSSNIWRQWYIYIFCCITRFLVWTVDIYNKFCTQKNAEKMLTGQKYTVFYYNGLVIDKKKIFFCSLTFRYISIYFKSISTRYWVQLGKRLELEEKRKNYFLYDSFILQS